MYISFVEGSWRFPGVALRAFLAVLGPPWEAWCSKSNIKPITKHIFSKLFVFATLDRVEGFWRPCCFISDFWGSELGTKSQQKLIQRVAWLLVSC